MDWEEQRISLINEIKSSVFDFDELAFRIYKLQYQYNPIYRRYADLIDRSISKVNSLEDIPFLPIRFFKEFEIKTGQFIPQSIFLSSGTGQLTRSRHFIRDIEWYHWVSKNCFSTSFSKSITEFNHLGYLPSYAENLQSSLLSMVDEFIKASGGGFFHHHPESLSNYITSHYDQKNILWGVSYALYEWIDQKNWSNQVTIIETGGMKGRNREMTREELHEKISLNFGVDRVCSEYGMTELLSQCYALDQGIFHPSPTMKVLPRKINDPLSKEFRKQTAALNIIDLANIDSCAFIATDDIGKVSLDNTFTLLGRLDHSDIRGCNLMI